MSDSMMQEQLTVGDPDEERPYQQYVSDSEIQVVPGTSCGILSTAGKSDWMAEMGPKFLSAKVGEIIWPGTHNSGSYCQEFDFNLVVHHDWLRWVGTHLLNCLGSSARRFASGWSRTQTLSVRQQLEYGVRYIDLRISKCLTDNSYYIVHSFCGPSIEEILEDIAAFARQHENECILVEVDPISEVDHVELHGIFEMKLGGLLLRRERGAGSVSPISLTLSHLIEKGRIIILYKLPPLYDFFNTVLSFWDSRCIHAPFVLSLEPSTKETFQLSEFSKFLSDYHGVSSKHQRIFHFMYALTPGLKEILRSAGMPVLTQRDNNGPASLQECAQLFNPCLRQFVNKIKECVKTENCHDIGMILSADYVEESELLEYVFFLNESKFRNN